MSRFSTFLFLLILSFPLLTTSNIIAQEKITITKLNAYLDRWEGKTVEVTGFLHYDDVNDRIEVWETLQAIEVRHRFNWERHIELKPGGYLPDDIEQYQESLVLVTGVVDKTTYYYPHAGNNLVVAYLDVISFEIKEKSMIKPLPEMEDYGDTPQATCDSCKFAILFSGYREWEHWNDIRQKYNYKKNKHKVCPDHIVVLFKGGSRNTAIIPNGTTDGAGNFTSGGAFDASPANLQKAFDYIKKKMKALNCKPAEFQFHSTGHGGGYHKRRGQGSGVSPVAGADSLEDGIAGGRLDKDGDEEKNKTNENDIIFRYRGQEDIDGDGRPDYEVRMVPDPRDTTKRIRQVRFDSDGNGSFDKVIGYDFNGDGRVSKADSAWSAPDLNRNGKIDDVGWDDVIQIADGSVITDDYLRNLMQKLIDSTGLDKAHSRAELSQCFSGSFLDDLQGVTTIATSGARRDEYAHGPVGLNGFNRYQKHFFDSLNAGHSWTDAHKMAADSTKKEMKRNGIVQTPQISDNSKTCIVLEGPYKKGNKVCIKIKNLCGKTVKVSSYINTYNFGIQAPNLAKQRFGDIELKNYEEKEYCVNLPTTTGRYCFLGGVTSVVDNKIDAKAEWLNNVEVKALVGSANKELKFYVGGNPDFNQEQVFLATDPTLLPPGWNVDLSHRSVTIEDHKPVEVTATFTIPPDAQIGDKAYFKIEGFTESPTEPLAGFVEGEIVIVEPGEEFFADLQAGWNLISLRAIPQSPIIKDIFPDANVLFGYREPVGYEEMMEYALNSGFWVMVPNNNRYQYLGQQIEEYTMSLEAGWSLIGGLSDSPAQPEVLGFGETPTLFRLNPEIGYEPCEIVEPGTAVWINLNQPAEIMMQPVTQMSKQEQASNVWQLPIIATGENYGYAFNKSSCTIGVSFDMENLLHAPPAPPEYTTDIAVVRVDYQGKPATERLYRDIQQEINPDDTLRWFIQLDPNGSFGDRKMQTTISWQPAMLDNGDVNQRWLLSTGIVTEGIGSDPIDMQKQNSISVIAADTTYYTVIYFKEKPNSVENNEQSRDLLYISSIIPNPFNNSVKVDFHLNRTASINIQIFDYFGRELLNVDEGVLSQGLNTWIWNGLDSRNKQVASGNYFMRITAKSGNDVITAVQIISKMK